MKTVKVRVNILLTVDIDAYDREYGTKSTPRQIAKDVRDTVYQTGVDAAFPPHSGVIAKSELLNR